MEWKDINTHRNAMAHSDPLCTRSILSDWTDMNGANNLILFVVDKRGNGAIFMIQGTKTRGNPHL